MTIKGSNVDKVHTNSDSSQQSVDILLPSKQELSRKNTNQKKMHPIVKLKSVVGVMDTEENGGESQKGPGRGHRNQWNIFLGWICETVRLLTTQGTSTKCSGKTREWANLDQVSHEKKGSQRK